MMQVLLILKKQNALHYFSIFAYLVLHINYAIAQELIVFDEIISVEEEHNGFYNFQPTEKGGSNWLSPYNYFEGKFFFRYEIIDYPSQEPLWLNICIWSDVVGSWESWKETCSPTIQIFNKSIYVIESSPKDWWVLNENVDFSRVNDIKHIGLVLWCHSDEEKVNMSPWVTEGADCWAERSNFLPLQLRLTVICVARDYAFSGWKKFGLASGLVKAQFTQK